MNEKPVEFITAGGDATLCTVFGAALTRETLHEALAELVTHGQVMLTQTKQLERLRAENKNLRAALAPFARLKPSFDEWRFAAQGRDELMQSRVRDDAFVLRREYPVAGDKTGDQRVTVAVRVADFREAHRVCNGQPESAPC